MIFGYNLRFFKIAIALISDPQAFGQVIVDPSKIPQDEVAFGATVTVLDTDLDEEEKITLVGDGDEDYDNGKYLITSPIGRGLLGKKEGETAEIEVPKGVINFKVLEISYE